MYDFKVNKRGQLIIPKRYLKKLGINAGYTVDVKSYDGEIIINPSYFCFHCKKPLPDELRERRACLTCPPAPPPVMIY